MDSIELDKIEASSSFDAMLTGETAFYNQKDYLETTRREFSSNEALPVTYRWDTEHKIVRFAKQFFSVIFFPAGIYQLYHSVVGKFSLILPAATPWLFGYPNNFANDCRSKINLESEWKYKRITLEVDDYKIDAIILGRPSTLGNKRWMLASNGNVEFYEYRLAYNRQFTDLLEMVDANAIMFNYPSVGASAGFPNREAMSKAYRAAMNFLEDQKDGIGAKEIIGYGISIGGGVQGDALRSHEFKKHIKYVIIQDRTFSDLSSAIRDYIAGAFSDTVGDVAGFFTKLFGWNISSIEAFKKLQVPQLIIQTAKVRYYEEIKDSSKLIDDGTISAEASLAKTLLDETSPKERRIFIGVPERHSSFFYDLSFFSRKIKELLELN